MTIGTDEQTLVQIGFRYALSLCPQRQDAEDLVQEACMRLYRKFGQLPERALLLTAIRNIYIDQYRRDKLVMFEPFADAGPEPQASYEQPLEASITLDELAEPLANLRQDEREALYLSAVEEYTAQEIADFTQRSRGTILSLIHRAKKKLYKSITKTDSPPPAAGAGRT